METPKVEAQKLTMVGSSDALMALASVIESLRSTLEWCREVGAKVEFEKTIESEFKIAVQSFNGLCRLQCD